MVRTGSDDTIRAGDRANGGDGARMTCQGANRVGGILFSDSKDGVGAGWQLQFPIGQPAILFIFEEPDSFVVAGGQLLAVRSKANGLDDIGEPAETRRSFLVCEVKDDDLSTSSSGQPTTRLIEVHRQD